MKRLQIAVLVVLALVGYAVAGASAAAPRAQLRNLLCQKALDPPARAVSITAVMRPVAGTRRMQVKFSLLSKSAGAASFSALTGTGLDTWQNPPAQKPPLGQRAADVWIVHRPVADLSAPAAYRFRVAFRWLGTQGKVLGSVTKTSRTCRQPELRPDLLVQSITFQPVTGHPKVDAYVVTIRNAGATAAGPFRVEFTDRTKAKSALVKRLGAHKTRKLQFVGPVCDSTAPPSLTIDPQRQVDDFNWANNTATAICA
jgi:hypothetical protein